ncbi:hypothetical protein QAD02_017214 [Eretmocerus hayati]|uniref:Uncharacterized protein n=1 Tax=Eretmocerus hayati TaxID=131215 RepID=A0ACC2PDN5_9HYME|nr:hypothetical protein QAD02_017214 [Eretmocerus hayati]
MNKKKSMNINFDNESDITIARRHLKGKIMSPETKFRHHLKERLHVLDLVKRTVEMGESNSLLLIGPRSSGKTTLINSVLRELSTLENFEDNALIVNLNGLVHTDDKLALKDATRQMQLENVVGNKVFGTFAENLSFLLESLKSGDKKRSKPVIFILDEFDLFCAHQNQTLLYNLFDVAQSAQAPICVIGITCRLDVIELLEKRVKSRFSHRQIFLYPGQTSESESPVSSFEDRLELFQDLLSLPDDENVNEIEQKVPNISPKFRALWNKKVRELAEDERIIKILKQMHNEDRSERKFRHFLAVLISFIGLDHRELVYEDFVRASKLMSPDDKTLVLEGLTVLEMCLLIAIKHETEIYDGEPFNFQKVLNRYLKFANQASNIESVQQPVIMKAFEHLVNLELIVPVGSTQRNEKEYQNYEFVLTADEVLKGVKNYHGLSTDVTQWADSSIM